MKVYYFLLSIIGIFILVGCQDMQDNRMVLLDEKIREINVSSSIGIGDMNEEILFSFKDEPSIKILENAIKTAVILPSSIQGTTPDYDLMVIYDEDLPKHPIHLWLGEENEESILIYMVGESETYFTSAKTTNQLYQLI
ncbi:hypothetical protein [Sutcliffiella rhizosphaerae]|uniref:YhfM-like domain-containing protein n=1 Tax=Sutcliffiella rhizosphaerae TaxID=2880967 RepID=A0ABM8YSV7_9BACI|nr:hypothetical protein [Sutcliffiella rhizosphaerae]CAG9623093.1 hypothetical protein BACCIP111883_03889 [Sutcliffiella rhizosphaerae]